MISVLLSLIVVLWGAFLLGGTAYLVIVHGWSRWWVVLAVLLAMALKPGRGCDE